MELGSPSLKKDTDLRVIKIIILMNNFMSNMFVFKSKRVRISLQVSIPGSIH